MIDMGIEPFLLVASVNVVAAQRLVRKICTNCQREIGVPAAYQQEIKNSLQNVPAEYLEGLDLKQLRLYKGAGCNKCGNTGYTTRFGIFEVLPATPEIQEMVLSKASPQKIYLAAAKLGMITMKQDGVIKALRGETTMDEVIRVTTE
jgi:type IV pilus assembly protein PilB